MTKAVEFIVTSTGNIEHRFHPKEKGQIQYEVIEGTLRVKVFDCQTPIRVMTWAAGTWRSIDTKWEK